MEWKKLLIEVQSAHESKRMSDRYEQPEYQINITTKWSSSLNVCILPLMSNQLCCPLCDGASVTTGTGVERNEFRL